LFIVAGKFALVRALRIEVLSVRLFCLGDGLGGEVEEVCPFRFITWSEIASCTASLHVLLELELEVSGELVFGSRFVKVFYFI
jgi:hypothetical protein